MTTESEWVTLQCLEVSQPLGRFYVATADSRDVVTISYSDVRRIEKERRDVETYLGIERPLSRKRVGELKEYVYSVDASFPSSVILSVASKHTQYEEGSGILRVKRKPDVAKVLDGQHRIAALEDYDGVPFQLVLTIFVDMDIEDQAMVFATINLEQTKVNKSLAYDLYEYAKARSPQKTAHNIVRVLDTRSGSPFEGMVKILGTAGDPGELLSQAVMVDALLDLTSKNPRKDRDLIKRGEMPDRATPSERQTLVFRDMFLDEQDADITVVLWRYFEQVEKKWPDHWRAPRRGFVLNRTTGFRALMQALPPIYWELGGPPSVPKETEFGRLFDMVSIPGESINRDEFPPGTGGQARLRNMILSQMGLQRQ